jgi:AraC-like DNA-binding protein
MSASNLWFICLPSAGMPANIVKYPTYQQIFPLPRLAHSCSYLIMKRVVMNVRRPEQPPAPTADLFLELTPRLMKAARSELDSSWRALPSRDPYNRIYYIEDGHGRVNLAGREIVLRPGNLYFLPAHTPVGYQTERRVVIQWLHCCLGPVSGVELGAFLPCRNEVTPAQPEQIRVLFSRLIQLHDRGAITGVSWAETLEIRGLLFQLLAACALPLGEAPPHRINQAQFQRFLPVLERIERTLEPPPTLPELARMLHMTPAAFSRRFAALFGLPPIQYQLGRRIATARQMLRASDVKLEEVACRLGFSDAFHFSKTFKRLTGLSPQQFRQRPSLPLP